MKNAYFGMLSFLALVVVASFGIQPAIAQTADDELQQIQLTEAYMTGYLSAAKRLGEIAEKIEASDNQADDKIRKELEELAKKNGFKSYEELELVIANISFILSGFDDKGKFTEPQLALKQELEEVKADKSLKPDAKEEMIAEITEALKSTPKMKYADNVQVVEKYLKELDQILQQMSEDEPPKGEADSTKK